MADDEDPGREPIIKTPDLSSFMPKIPDVSAITDVAKQARSISDIGKKSREISEHFGNTAYARNARRVTEMREAQQRAMDGIQANLQEYHEGIAQEKAEALAREEEALRLQAALVEQQQELLGYQADLVAEQKKQAGEARTTRWLEIAVLAVSVAALVVGIVALTRM